MVAENAIYGAKFNFRHKARCGKPVYRLKVSSEKRFFRRKFNSRQKAHCGKRVFWQKAGSENAFSVGRGVAVNAFSGGRREAEHGFRCVNSNIRVKASC